VSSPPCDRALKKKKKKGKKKKKRKREFGLMAEKLEIKTPGAPAAIGPYCQGVKNVVEAAGASLDDVVKTTVYMTDLSEFNEMNEVYGRFFKPPYPARATVEVKALPRGVVIEIDATAVSGR
jgi:2-iminobutanoate/2-iminopropanoate deaminase